MSYFTLWLLISSHIYKVACRFLTGVFFWALSMDLKKLFIWKKPLFSEDRLCIKGESNQSKQAVAAGNSRAN